MGVLVERFARAAAEIAGLANVTVRHSDIVSSERLAAGEPMALERDVARSVGLLLDDALAATYDDLASVRITWTVEEKHHGSLLVPDWFDLEDAFVLPTEHGVTGAEADFLTELHLIECLDAEHWNAFRTVGWAKEQIDNEQMEIWTRIPGKRAPLDLRLACDWNSYLERMLLARGAESFALTLVPDDAIPHDQRASVRYFLRRFCAAAALFRDRELDEFVAVTAERARRL